MLAKNWKRIGMLIIIIACLFNIVTKLVTKMSYLSQLTQTAEYAYEEQKEVNKIEE